MQMRWNSADAFTARLFADAGIGPGQRVLDIGCGNGAGTRMVAELISLEDEVIGIDRNGTALEMARKSFAEEGLANARFVEGDLNSLPSNIGQFDVIVGRRVLMYQPDAAATLRHLRDVLKPGGRILLQEHDASGTPLHHASLPLHEKIHHLMFETVRREGADLRMGFHLSPALEAAGFVVEELRAQATVLSPVMSHPIETIVRSMLPRMIATEVITEGELDVDDLDERLAHERRAANATCLWELVFGIRAHC